MNIDDKKDPATVNLDSLLSHVEKLRSLLLNPHPGLISWCQAYARQMEAITAFWKHSGEKDES